MSFLIGLVKWSLYFDKLKKMINRSFVTVCAEYYNCDKEEAKDGFKNQIKSVLDKVPIILGIILRKEEEMLFWLLDATMKVCFHIFCLDLRYNCYPTSY